LFIIESFLFGQCQIIADKCSSCEKHYTDCRSTRESGDLDIITHNLNDPTHANQNLNGQKEHLVQSPCAGLRLNGLVHRTQSVYPTLNTDRSFTTNVDCSLLLNIYFIAYFRLAVWNKQVFCFSKLLRYFCLCCLTFLVIYTIVSYTIINHKVFLCHTYVWLQFVFGLF
jgi:hypothetical protein